MHVLITGGAGFIGSHLVDLHLARGDSVHVVDDLSTGARANIAQHEDNPNFRFDEADVLTWDRIDRVVGWADRIYHLAAIVGVYRVIAEPTKVLATNIVGCERILRAAHAGGWKPQVVLASSSEVYGHNDESLLREDQDLTVSTRAGTRWGYSVSKIADEALGLSYAQRYGIPAVIARFFNTVGPRQVGRYGMVVPRFVAQAVRNEPITVFGGGQQTRSFCDARDTVVALDALATHGKRNTFVANVGNDREISILQLAELVIERANSRSVIEHVALKEAYGEDFEDIRRRRPDLSRLRSMTGFEHRFTLEQTIDDLIAIERKRMEDARNGHCTWFVLSPNALLSVVGLLRGPDKTVPTPAEDWQQAVVDVVIPAFKEEDNIIHCLASLARQDKRPRNIILVDDGGKDQTVPRAREYAAAVGLNLIVIERNSSIGKTPTIKRQAREFDSDVEFILDGDTYLESPQYISRCVQELYQGVGIASACGTVLPMRPKDRHALAETPEFREWHGAQTYDDPHARRGALHSVWWWITNTYRECLYMFLQRFVYKGQMVFFGSITNPVGCAVAYRRKYVKDLFDKYEPIFGDDLTNSEDIFIGFALNNEGYRNVQLQDVVARSEEPEVQRLPRQVYLWSSSFLQSCYYFDPLLRTPFKLFKRARKKREEKKAGVAELRKIAEQYRQPFGEKYTLEYGRPIGWAMFLSAIEKIGFPTALIIMTILRMWEPLAVTLIAEVIVSLAVLFVVGRGQRLAMVAKGIIMTPVRYAMILADTITIARFAGDLWITGNRKWRK